MEDSNDYKIQLAYHYTSSVRGKCRLLIAAKKNYNIEPSIEHLKILIESG